MWNIRPVKENGNAETSCTIKTKFLEGERNMTEQAVAIAITLLILVNALKE